MYLAITARKVYVQVVQYDSAENALGFQLVHSCALECAIRIHSAQTWTHQLFLLCMYCTEAFIAAEDRPFRDATQVGAKNIYYTSIGEFADCARLNCAGTWYMVIILTGNPLPI